MDGELHLDALFFQHVGHFAQRVLGLRNGHAVTRNDDHLFRLFQHEGGIGRTALLVRALFARLAGSAAAIICAKPACDYRDEAAVHRPAHDVAEDRTRAADQRAGDDHRRVAERKAHRRCRPARVGVQHRDHDWHVRPADGDDQQEADDEGENGQPGDQRQGFRRTGHGEERGEHDDRSQRAEIDDMARRKQDRRSAHPARQFGEGDDRTGESNRPDRDAEAHLDLADRLDPVSAENAERAWIEIGRPAHQHSGKSDQRVEGRDQFGHRGHGDATGGDKANDRADCDRDQYFEDVGDVMGHQRRHHRDQHPDHAKAIARPARCGRRQAAQGEDEEHTRNEVSQRYPRVHRLASRGGCGGSE